MRAHSVLAYTIDGASKASGLGRTTIYGLIGSGQLGAVKAGNRTLIPADSLHAYIDGLPAAEITTGQSRSANTRQQAA